MKTLSELQLATLATLNIPVWQLRNDCEPVIDAQMSTEHDTVVENPDDANVVAATAEVVLSAVQATNTAAEIEIEKTVLPGIALTFHHQHKAFIHDVLLAWHKQDLPLVNQPSPSANERYQYYWHQSDEIKLTEDTIYTPKLSLITPQQKRQLWHLLSQC